MNYNNSSMLLQLSSTSLGADMNSGAIRIREHVGFMIQMIWTGASVDGVFKLQVSADSSSTPDSGSWEDLTAPVTSLYTAAGAGKVAWNVNGIMASWVRVVFTRASGTGTITSANFILKGY